MAFVATKIICTIGPVTQSEDMLEKLMDAGMNVARMNFSHGTHEYHAQTIANIRAVCERTGKSCAIMLDTKGPEIRTIKLAGGKNVDLEAGQKFTFLTDTAVVGDSTQVAVTYADLPKSMTIGGSIMVDDGLIELTVDSIDEGAGKVECTVVNGGNLGENKGVNLPGVVVTLPAITEKDKSDILFCKAQKLDAIAASFIRKREDVQCIRDILGADSAHIKIISKIENLEGLENFPSILEESDGIMVARGDLGVEIPLEKVCLAQKMMIEQSNAAGKPIVTATQMLESMIVNPRPTRAEATDVANAVFDGTDCVMLSGETAKGSYPVEAVMTMRKICLEAEAAKSFSRPAPTEPDSEEAAAVTPWEPRPIPHLGPICKAAAMMSAGCDAKLIVARTETGSTALMLSKQRPGIPILAISDNACTARQLNFSRGVLPMHTPEMTDISVAMKAALSTAMTADIIAAGQFVVNVRGFVSGVVGTTNGVSLLRVPAAVDSLTGDYDTRGLTPMQKPGVPATGIPPELNIA